MINGEPGLITWLVEVALVIQRNRLEEHRQRRIRDGGGGAGTQHRGRVIGARRTRHHEPRNVTQHSDGVVIVEVAAEALLIAKTSDPDDHRVAEPAAGEERQGRTLAA